MLSRDGIDLERDVSQRLHRVLLPKLTLPHPASKQQNNILDLFASWGVGGEAEFIFSMFFYTLALSVCFCDVSVVCARAVKVCQISYFQGKTSEVLN